MVTGFGRLEGRAVAIIANQPRFNAGAIDIDASVKAARFVRFADAFNIPILAFVGVPGSEYAFRRRLRRSGFKVALRAVVSDSISHGK